MKSSRIKSAAALNVVFDSLSSAAKYAIRTTLSAALNSPIVSAVRVETAGNDCLVMYDMMLRVDCQSDRICVDRRKTHAGALRAPEYGLTLSRPRKTLTVGYPSTPKSLHSSVSSVQSTLTRGIFFSFSVVAASSYSGARALQWPHHGAKNSARTRSCSLTKSLKVSLKLVRRLS